MIRTQTKPKAPAFLDVFYFIQRHSPDADAWTTAFLASTPRNLATQALRSFQCSDFTAGLHDLAEYRRTILRSTGLKSAQRHLGLRWYYSVLAYYLYSTKRFDHALAAMDAAEQVVLDAFEEHDFLLPMLSICVESLTQKARVAREQACWSQVETYLDKARDIYAGAVPLYVTKTGQPIFRVAILDYMRRIIPGLSSSEMTAHDVRMATDPAYCRTMEETDIHMVYLLPGFVISYTVV